VTGPIDRRSRLLTDHSVLGIDYLYVDTATQTALDVHFMSPPSAAQQARITADLVSITAPLGDAAPVAVTSVEFPAVSGDVFLRVHTAIAGTFTRYVLRLADPSTPPQLFDPYFASVEFSFKAGCYSDIDCDHSAHTCAAEATVDFPVDYQARDFWSLRTALLDFASQRYPRWADRLEADAAVMLAEAMAALGDELSYYQDRLAREAYLETATQRRSIRRHARLVDYRIHDGLGATTWIDITASSAASIVAGTTLWAMRDGTRVDYSVGRGLDEIITETAYSIDPSRNATNLIPYQWDSGDLCLPAGSTEMWLTGDLVSALPLDDTSADPTPGRWVLLRTDPADPALPGRRQLVRVVQAETVHDPLANIDTTHIVWEPEQALPAEFDLTCLHVHANIVPAVAGLHLTRTFVIGPGNDAVPSPASLLAAENPQPEDPNDPAWAIERLGSNDSVTYLFSLYRTDTDELVWRGSTGDDGQDQGDPRLANPELQLIEQSGPPGGPYINRGTWTWRPNLLDAPAASAVEKVFTLDDGMWRRIVGYQRPGAEVVHQDYASDDGFTIRFGDGVFGLTPARGTRFRVDYLVGNGRRGNLPAGAVRWFDQTDPALSAVAAVENPFAIDSGIDPESPDEIRELAPEAFRALTYRAVRPEDYAEAAERLDWVQRAGCAFRWTGSWQTAFVTPDPLGGVTVSASQRGDLERQIDRFRQAGRETHALDPRYADLDLRIGFCVAETAYPAEVKVRVGTALSGPPTGFFSPDHFTFGTPLYRSALEAAIQGVPGVRAVEDITFRRRGTFNWTTLPAAYLPGRNEVIRVENDPLHPDRGSIQLTAEGGA
jgi:hypothetical protein